MTDEQHQTYLKEMTDAIERSVAVSIEKTVNGKIRRLDEKLTQYIVDDTEWKEIATPIIKAGTNLTGAGKIMVYFFGGLATISAGVAVIKYAILHIIK